MNDVKLLGLQPECMIFRDMCRDFILGIGQTYNPSKINDDDTEFFKNCIGGSRFKFCQILLFLSEMHQNLWWQMTWPQTQYVSSRVPAATGVWGGYQIQIHSCVRVGMGRG